jgi:2-polyprenyl-3-methyl-5-hydroxy-6-metoxy-1,4-benzoquinol methylase
MTNELPASAFRRIAKLSIRLWDWHYVSAKLRSDPVYGAVVKELAGSTLPVLDIGCGIGLLAFYLRESGFTPAITGFDYDAGKIDSAQGMSARSGFAGLSFMNGDARTDCRISAGMWSSSTSCNSSSVRSRRRCCARRRSVWPQAGNW